jgi:exodeoxyribonuclease VII small subunit
MTEQEFEFAAEFAAPVSPQQEPTVDPEPTPAEAAPHGAAEPAETADVSETAPGDGDQQMTFEMALERLEAVVAEMEGGRLSLDASMQRFEEGTRLAQFCTARLAESEAKVEKLLRRTSDGGDWAPLEDGNSQQPTPSGNAG